MKAFFAAAVLGLFTVGCGAGGSGSSCCDPNNSGCSSNKCDTFCRFCQ